MAASQSGSADSTDWPLAIALDGNVQAADADLKTVGNGGFVQNANGYDIRPYSSNDCATGALTYELVYYQASTGKLEMHVKIPTLSAATDTVIYLCFGDSGISTDGSSASTWNSNYKAVYHMKDGSTLSVTDATGANNGTNNSATALAGEIDGGAGFSGTNQYIATNIPSSALDISAGTVETWQYNTRAHDSSTIEVSWSGEAFAGTPAISFQHYSNNKLYVGWYVSGVDYRVIINASAGNYPQTTWIHYVLTWNTSGNSTLYANGTSIGTGNTNPPVTTDTGISMKLGRQGDYAIPNYFSGRLDEWRFLNTNISTSWITADYNSQKASSNFITWGAKTAVRSPSPFGHINNPVSFGGF